MLLVAFRLLCCLPMHSAVFSGQEKTRIVRSSPSLWGGQQNVTGAGSRNIAEFALFKNNCLFTGVLNRSLSVALVIRCEYFFENHWLLNRFPVL